MATLDIAGRTVDIDDKFLTLPNDQQNAIVAEIAGSLGIKPQASATERATGAGKAFASGVGQGVADAAGLPGDAVKMAGESADWLASKLGAPAGAVTKAVSGAIPSGRSIARAVGAGPAFDAITEAIPERVKEVANPLKGSEQAAREVQALFGPFYEPQTVPEEYARTIGRFLPGAAVPGGGGVVRNVVVGGVLPAIASETAGQAFKGKPVEPIARAVAGVGAGVGGALATRPGAAERVLQSSAGRVTPQEIDAAEALVRQAADEGINLSRAEAIQAVTSGRTNLGDLQRRVEGMGGMRDFYAERPAQNEAAARRTFDTMSPASPDPSQIGPQASRTAEGLVNDVRSAINQATRPMYRAGERNLVPQQVHDAMMQDPLFAETLATIRNDPARNAVVRGADNRSVGMYDAVAKELEQRSRNAAQPLNPEANQTIASVTGNLGGDVKDIAIAADRAATGGPSSYEAALATQERLRQQYLNPLLNGPIGKLARDDVSTRSAVEVLFPTNPLPNSQAEITDTVRALSRRNPGVANDLVRAHSEMTFNEAAQRLATAGEAQGGGAKFAAVLRGNPQQAENLEAAVRALPHGDTIWRGFDRVLEVMEAQQYRMPIGAQTAFNKLNLDQMAKGGAKNAVAEAVTSGGLKLPEKVKETFQNWNLGRNLDEISWMLTSPDAAQRFRQLLSVPPSSVQFAALLGRLTSIGVNGARSADRPEERRNVAGAR